MREDRSGRRIYRLLGLCLITLGTVWGCAGLIPQEVQYRVDMDPLLPEGRGDFFVDIDDSSMVFSKEGLLIKVRNLPDADLNTRFPSLFDGRHVNPYTHEAKDPDKGYIPPRFTVFEVEVINNTYAKVEFDPAQAVMISDGETYRYYDPGREGAVILGGNSFNKYYKMELGTSGNEREVNLERMGTIYKTVYHRDRPIFKEDRRVGLLVFDPLPPENDELLLKFNEFVLSFDASGNPEETIDIEFRFKVDQGVVKVAAKAGTE
ncbi:MAG: hypothetical protein GKR89_16565 [Candidatus Latescibacteria bacterium]|nr:hypothetical protein [Candidatus Latescibacterota bacterium]